MKKKKIVSKKLQITKSTVVNLDDLQLKGAKGGGPTENPRWCPTLESTYCGDCDTIEFPCTQEICI